MSHHDPASFDEMVLIGELFGNVRLTDGQVEDKNSVEYKEDPEEEYFDVEYLDYEYLDGNIDQDHVN